METKHTAGPWEADKVAVRSSGPDGRQVCLCEISVRGRSYYETYDEAIANASLIAAAPDLLNALAAACTSLELHAASARHYAAAGWDTAANTGLAAELERNAGYYREIIAKAEGAQP